MKKKLILALILMSAVTVSGEDEFFEDSSIPSMTLNETVVTGEKFGTTVRNTTKGITVLTSKDIKKSGAKDVSDVLSCVNVNVCLKVRCRFWASS